MPESVGSIFIDPFVALGLGLLVGLQKERVASPLAGLKTFGLASLFGAVSALLATTVGGWFLGAGLLTVLGVLVIGNTIMIHSGEATPGQTTEVGLLAMYAIGAYTVLGPTSVAVMLGTAVALLLHLRDELRGFVMKMSDREARAMMQFAVAWLVILPVLPDETFGPFDVLNPRHIWMMVVLIVGLNLAGYVTFRALSTRGGTAVAGLLGGVISSTATTFAYARLARDDGGHPGTAALVIWIASAVVYVRVLVEIGAVAPGFLSTAAPPLLVMIALFVLVAALAWRTVTRAEDSPLRPRNPTHLRLAILFAGVYATVLFAVAAVEDTFGQTGLYVTAALSGISDMDAITLSTSRLVADGRLDERVAWRLILAASLSNILFKLGVTTVIGGPMLGRRFARYAVVALLGGVAVIAFWP